MPFQQNIDSARAEKIGAHGVTKAALDDALRRAEAALDWVRDAHAKSTPAAVAACRRRPTISTRSRKAAARLRAGATDVVVLGTGGSSLGGQTLAQLAGVGVRGIEAFRAGPRLHFMDNLDPATYGGAAREAAARDHALHRDLEIRRHRRDADADRGRALGRQGGRA